MAEEIVKTSQEGELQQQGLDNVQVELNYVFEKLENVELPERGLKLTASLLGSLKLATDGVLHKTQSEIGTPIFGSEKIALPAWKLQCRVCPQILLLSLCWMDLPKAIFKCRVRQLNTCKRGTWQN